MYTTLEILEAYKAHHKLDSDYAAAKKLGFNKQRISSWRSGHTMSEDVALDIAEEIGLDPAQAVLGVIAERCGETRLGAFIKKMKDDMAA